MSQSPSQFVFGYGSLVGHAPTRPALLRGHRRVWGVAMDNAVDIPGYKSYRRVDDGARPAVYVAFLDIVQDVGATVAGSLLAVDDTALRALDARERNYDRVDVSSSVDGEPAGTIWAYRGSSAGRERLRRGVELGSAVVEAGYVEGVRALLAALGIAEDIGPPAALPVMSLQRVEVLPAP